MGHAANRVLLEILAADGRLSRQGLLLGLRRLGHAPSAADWRHFADRLLLALGSLLVLSGIVFFFAYNWQTLHRFSKLGLVTVALTLCTLAAVGVGSNAARQAWLAGACVLAGVLLAVTGQIYQSGADSELLFIAWAALILPWVVLARAAWLWLFWLLLGNAALLLWIAGRLDVWAFLVLADSLFWWPLLFNAAALVVWELGWPRLRWLQASYGPRIVALVAAVCATALGVGWWWLNGERGWRWMPYTPLLYLAWLGACLWFYQRRRCDIVPLAAGAFSAICVITAGIARHLDFRHAWEISFLFLGLLVAALTAAAAVWLRRLSAAWETSA